MGVDLGGKGWYFTKSLVGVQHTMKKWTQSDMSLYKNEVSIFFRTMEKGVKKIKIQEKIFCKMLQNCPMTDFSEKLYQI